ncbi:MAG TPA: hypothetical protein VFY87_23430 [Geminicoccaceae bacterium]|nr:hypothetical protein [Geminicoccaceae bacterium]
MLHEQVPMLRPRHAAAKSLAAALAASVAFPVHAQSTNFCTEAGGQIELGFAVKPSLVAHSDAIMDTTFADAGLSGGDPTERLFSLKHTIGAILESAQAPNTPAAREAFLQTMLDTFQRTPALMLNREAGVLMPFDSRTGEPTRLTPAGLLDDGPASAIGMEPLAVFNRFDLAPANWSHCGEHRIVYGKRNPDVPSPPNRFLLIFEAAVPNPDPAAGEAGCRPITEFWAGLSGISDEGEVAKKLAAFFYEGKTDPQLATADLAGPVVSFRNYGGDGSRGQVRGNLFMEFPWQLREWLTQLTFDPAGNQLEFVVETVKDNPLAELYGDQLTTDILDANIPAAATALHGDFVQALKSDISQNLMSEETEKHQSLKEGLDEFNLGTDPTAAVDEPKILLNTIALGSDDRFNEHQSTSLGPDDEPRLLAGSKMRTVLGQLAAIPTTNVNMQTADVILNRAQAGTCAGCHQTAVNLTVRGNPDGSAVLWPAVHGAFVHVDETTRELSPALETSFLPFRRYVLGRHLCKDAGPAVVAAVEPGSGPETATTGPAGEYGMRFVDSIVSTFVAASSGSAAAAEASGAGGPSLVARAEQLEPAQRAALRRKVREEIAQARSLERQRPGAYVEQRGPH